MSATDDSEVLAQTPASRLAGYLRGGGVIVPLLTTLLAFLIGGLVMLVTPGPAFVVIPIGLAMLALEFAWAERLLDSTLERGVEAKDMAMGASRRQKIVGIAAIVCALAAAGALGLLYLT